MRGWGWWRRSGSSAGGGDPAEVAGTRGAGADSGGAPGVQRAAWRGLLPPLRADSLALRPVSAPDLLPRQLVSRTPAPAVLADVTRHRAQTLPRTVGSVTGLLIAHA